MPSPRCVIAQCLAIYVGLAVLAAFPFIDFLPVKPRYSNAIACLPHEYDRTSTYFQWLVYIPLVSLIPTGYVLYVTFDILHRKLLPPTGKRRELSIYFFRIVVVFLTMWIPSIFLLFVAGGWFPVSSVVVGGSWSHLQGAVSATASVMKRDIREAVWEFLTCRSPSFDRERRRTPSQSNTNNFAQRSRTRGGGPMIRSSSSGFLSEIEFGPADSTREWYMEKSDKEQLDDEVSSCEMAPSSMTEPSLPAEEYGRV